MKTKQKYIVRTDRAGVFYGEVKSKTKDAIVMTNVRKIFYWNGACAVEELALNGTKLPNDCKLTVTIPEMEIASPIQIIPCSKESVKILNSIAIWKK
jgi:hypothetical protein